MHKIIPLHNNIKRNFFLEYLLLKILNIFFIFALKNLTNMQNV